MSLQMQHLTGTANMALDMDEGQWCHSLVLVLHAYKVDPPKQCDGGTSGHKQHQHQHRQQHQQSATNDGQVEDGNGGRASKGMQEVGRDQEIKAQKEEVNDPSLPQVRTTRIKWDTGVEELEERKRDNGSVWYNLAEQQQQHELPQHQHQRAHGVLHKLRLLSSEAQATATKLTKQQDACKRARRRMQAHLRTR
jgi:hypothetical protein